MKNADYRKHNDRTGNSSTYHKKDGTNTRAVLKREAKKEAADAMSMKPVKRDKRNIGKRVVVSHVGSWLQGRTGTIKGFRGDRTKGDPYIQVYIDDLHHIETICASSLKYI